MDGTAPPDGDASGGGLCEAAWKDHREALTAWLRALLRDEHAAADCLQMTFSRLVETGGPPVAGNLRGWLFRVAQNFARQLQRRRGVELQGLERLAFMRQLADRESTGASDELLRRERLGQVTMAVRQLSNAQQEVLRLRMEEGLKFAEIASRLQLPLGTVLTRMRLALKAIRSQIGDDNPAAD